MPQAGAKAGFWRILYKNCERCSSLFVVSTGHRAQRFCSHSCARSTDAEKRRPKITKEMLEGLNLKQSPSGKLAYAAKEFGCSKSFVAARAKELGFNFMTDRADKTKHGHREQNYAKLTGCVICPERRCTEAAHIVPRREGGSGEIHNIAPLCPTHHSRYDKGLLTAEETEKLMVFVESKMTQSAVN